MQTINKFKVGDIVTVKIINGTWFIVKKYYYYEDKKIRYGLKRLDSFYFIEHIPEERIMLITDILRQYTPFEKFKKWAVINYEKYF